MVEDAGDEAVEAEPAPTNVTNAATQGEFDNETTAMHEAHVL